MTNTQLKYVISSGIFLTVFIPLIISKSLLFPFISGKAFLFRLITEIIFFAWIVLAIKDSQYRPKFSWISISVLIFLIAIGIADILSENPTKSFWSNFERMEGYIGILHFAAFFLVASSVFKTKEIWNKFFATSIGASVIMSIYSIFQLAGKITINQGGVRVDGTFGNATYLGIYMVFHIFIAFYLILQSKTSVQRYVLFSTALLNVVILYYTATRGAILGLIGGGLLTFLVLLIKSEKGDKIRKVALISIVSISALVGVFLISKNNSYIRNNPVLSRFASLSVAEIKTQGRYYVWPIAWKGFIERPIFGWGQESFNFVFNKYYNPAMYSQEPWFDRTHNIVLDWLVAGGLFGLLSYGFMLLALVYSIFISRSLSVKDKAVFLGLVSAYVFHNLFVFDQIGSYILFFSLLAFLHINSENTAPTFLRNIASRIGAFINKESMFPVISASAVIVFVCTLYFWNYSPWQTNKSLMKVLQASNDGKVLTAAEYETPLLGSNLGFSESVEHVSNVSIGLANSQLEVAKKQEIYNLVESAFGKQIAFAPNDSRYLLFHGFFLSAFGNNEKALEAFKEASKYSPNKQTIYFEIGNSLMNLGRSTEALATFKKAYELDPSFGEARLIYGLVALANGEQALSNTILEGIDKDKIIFDDRYISILANLGRFNDIVNIVKERINREPTNINHRITLAAAYLQSNQRQLAIAALQEVIKIDPSAKEKMEYYISEIQAGRNP